MAELLNPKITRYSLSQRNGPTVYPADNFDENQDAQTIREAIKGIKQNNVAIANVLCRRSEEQRIKIRDAYQENFKRDLIADLKADIYWSVEKVFVALLTPSIEYQCQELAKAVHDKDEETDEGVLFDILLPLSPKEIEDIKNCYQRLFNQSLESQINGQFKQFFLSLLAGNRNEPGVIDEIGAEVDAKRLFQKGVHTYLNEGSVFVELFTQKSYAQLKLICENYTKLAGDSLENKIYEDTDDEIGDDLVMIVKAINGNAEFIARRFYRSMKGIGTNDSQLIRLVVIHAEKDMIGIKLAFDSLYQEPLDKFIEVRPLFY